MFWCTIDHDQVLKTWSGGPQNGLVLSLRLCDVRALLASKSDKKAIINLYSCVFGKRNYRVLVSVCVCVCVCVSVFVCVCLFLHDNSKRNRSRNTKSEYIVVYENSSDEFDI